MQAAVSLARPVGLQATADVPCWIAEAEARGWRWASVAWRRAAAVPGARFDEALAEIVVSRWPQIFRLTNLQFAGAPFRLAPWQEIIVRMLFGWRVPAQSYDPMTGERAPVEVRLFRRLLLWIPRKNGKTEFLAALALMFWYGDALPGGEGYCFAYNAKQAKIVFNKMRAMISRDKRLARDINQFALSLFNARAQAKFEVLTGTAEGKHGFAPYVVVGDEIHEWRDRDLADFLEGGMGPLLQPVQLYASTAGIKTQETGYNLFLETKKILDGPINPPTAENDTGEGIYDPRTLAVLFAAEDEDDWRDEKTWAKVNPNIGISPTVEFLRGVYAKAKSNPRMESVFKRYHLNIYVDAAVKWLDMARWDACCDDKKSWKTRAERLRGRACYGGIDLSSVKDLTALVWLFPPLEPKEKFEVIAKFWCPADSIEQRSREDRVAYDRWAKMGALTPTPGDMVDQNYVMHAILADAEMFDVKMIGYDPMFATKLLADLQDEGFGAERLLKVRQGHLTLAEPTKMLEVEVLAGRFDHGGHPVLRWMAQNAHIRFDRNMNFVPDKKCSRDKIDGIAATVNALTALLTAEPAGSGFLDY
ncbi:terminase large subunit [Methylosinus sp. Sm6]|uniref:terminase large subunit n=1 Tax=Methylosinus sp. Sm6 TaxID=2866948 RepID=UPI001C997C2C|nr:terminase TerL endonuclease subunit [Methylosinus sp. Sm6]MBY6242830.1 hypothetical protein [Methylosinus sp. Sm6]